MEYSGGRRDVCPVRCGPVRASISQVTPVLRRSSFLGRLPDEMKGNMLGRSTPSPERAPDGPLSPNGSIKSADTAAATLLHDQPAETDTGVHNGTAPADTPTHGPDATPTAPPPAHGEVERGAQEAPANSNGKPEPKTSDEDGMPAAGRDQPASDNRLKESDEKDKPRAGVRTSLTAAGRALLGRRGLRPTVLGVALAALALALGVSSALSVALLVVGVLMLIVGLMGPRLQGRFAIEFGPNGASLEIQTHMAPPGRTRIAETLAPWRPTDAPIASGDGAAGSNPAHDRTSTVALLNNVDSP
jgi:hypothetical protein